MGATLFMNNRYDSHDPNTYSAANTVDLSQAFAHKVLRNTYSLLAMTLAFSALTCYVSMAMNVSRLPFWILIIGMYGLMFLTMKLRNSAWGLLSIFAFTGFLGFTLAPTLNMYMHLPNGGSIILSALGLTAFAFFGLSAFVLITRKDMSFLGNFITVGFFVLLGAMVLSFFLPVPGFYLAISAGFVLFSSAAILYQTSEIINGGETNYIMATITLFVSIYNLFVSLLAIIGIGSND